MTLKILGKFSPWKSLVLAWGICFAIWLLSLHVHLGATTPVMKAPLDLPKLLLLFSHFHQRPAELTRIVTRLKVYDEIFLLVNTYDFLRKYLLEDRCLVYFNHLLMSNPDWLVNPDERVSFNRAAYNKFERYREEQLNNWNNKAKEAERENNDPPPKPTEEQLRQDYNVLRQTVMDDEQTLHDFVAHVRVFEKCYMHTKDDAKHADDTAFVRKQRAFLTNNVDYLVSPNEPSRAGSVFRHKFYCTDIERKVFPWLTTEYPIFTRWNGQKPFFPGSEYLLLRNRGCFLNDFKRRLNGRGIVMTLLDSHIEDAGRLLRVLRYFRNPYPIQVVFHLNLSPDSQYKLIKAARNDFMNLPPQDIWFVNAERSITKQYLPKFKGFANKIMATLFNSFEDMFFLDADTVPLKDMDYFFTLKKYVQWGTMFYKDRAAYQFRSRDDVVLFEKLLPSVEDSMVFNIHQTTNYTIHNEFFRGLSHYMESGAVVLNRKKHFMQPLMMAIMNFYQPIVTRIYGDKELYWLSLVLGGDSYTFNENFAAAIGELTPESERHKDINNIKSFRSQEICSNHPAHISDEDNQTLVWFNSGFRFCGNAMKLKVDFEKEFNQGKRYTHLKTLEEFKTFFVDKLKITHAIIPPFDPEHRSMKNLEHEPEAAWTMMNYCNGYCWCAYSLMGGYYKDGEDTKSNQMEGVLVKFSPEQVTLYDEVADIWIADLGW